MSSLLAYRFSMVGDFSQTWDLLPGFQAALANVGHEGFGEDDGAVLLLADLEE
jgi:hypothetical protein